MSKPHLQAFQDELMHKLPIARGLEFQYKKETNVHFSSQRLQNDRLSTRSSLQLPYRYAERTQSA